MGIMLGNQSPEQIASRLGIKLAPADIKLLRSTWQQRSENIKKGKWHCFYTPFVMVCGDIKTAGKMRDLFMRYDLSHAEQFGIAWEK